MPFAFISPLKDRRGPKSAFALCHPSEVQDWADGKAPDGTQLVSLSHCWEAREHCDPYGYQLSKLAKALKVEEWVFIDYVSLYQFQRLSQQQNLSFGRAMQHMHVLYCHDKTSTLRIESLTPEADIAEAERKQDSVILYHHPTGLVKPVPVSELVRNRTPYGTTSSTKARQADTTGGGLQYPKKPAARKGRKERLARQQSSAMLRPESAIHGPQTVGVWLTHLIQPSQSSTAPTSRIPHGRLSCLPGTKLRLQLPRASSVGRSVETPHHGRRKPARGPPSKSFPMARDPKRQ